MNESDATRPAESADEPTAGHSDTRRSHSQNRFSGVDTSDSGVYGRNGETGRGAELSTACPRCGDPASGAVITEPGIEKIVPCGCRIAVDGGSVQADERTFDADELWECEAPNQPGHYIDPETVEFTDKDRHSVVVDATCARCGAELRGTVAAWNMTRTWPTSVELEGRR